MKESLIKLGELTSGIGDLLGAVVVGVLAYVISYLKKKVERKDFFSVEKVLNRNMRVQSILYECRGAFDCDRVKLFQFHNGDYFLSGESVQKITLTHFALKRGISSPITNPPLYQNIPVSVILAGLNQIIAPKSVYFEQIQNLPDEFYLKDALRSTGCHSVAMAAVTNQYNKIFGLLILTWIDPCEKPQKIKDLWVYAKEIGLEIAYQNKKW